MFDFGRITLFCLEKRLSKHKMTICSKNLSGAMAPLVPPGYVYVSMCGDFIVVWKKFWKDNYLFEVELLQLFLQLRKPSRAAGEAFAGRMLCRPAIEE